MAGYVPRYRERALKYGKLVVVRSIVYNFLRTIVYNFQFNMANYWWVARPIYLQREAMADPIQGSKMHGHPTPVKKWL
jgi:hypothetical protein